MWAKHASPQATYWCLIKKISGGSVRTWCKGKWPVTDTYSAEDSPSGKRCQACLDNASVSKRFDNSEG